MTTNTNPDFDVQSLVGAEASPANGTASAPEEPTLDPSGRFIDLDRLRLTQDFASMTGTRAVVTSVPVRKPDATWYVRVHADPTMRLRTLALRVKETGDYYLVDPDLRAAVATELVPIVFFLAISFDGLVFLWPVQLPDAEGRHNEWHKATLVAAEDRATVSWIRISANMTKRGYDVRVAGSDLGEPRWPEESFEEIVRVAFRDRYIDSVDHPVLKRLRGEV